MSIPSPEWSYFDFTAWLSTMGIDFTLFGNPLRVHAYALCILLGIILATVMTSKRLTKRGAEPGIVLDIILFAVPLGIIGARAYHVISHPGDYFYEGADFFKVFAIQEGGIAIFGALIGGALGAWIGCRLSGIRFWTFADAVAPGLLLAQAAGRLGNYFNHELFGTPTTLPWGLEIEASNPAFPIGLPEGTLFHPTFLYEIVWNLLGVAVILWAERSFRLQWGRVLGVYLIWYGLGRSVFETIRVDPSELFLGIRFNVWGAFAAIAIGLAILIIQGRRHPGAEPSPYRSGVEWSPESAEVDSKDVYSDEELRVDDATGATDVDKIDPDTTSVQGKKSQKVG